MLVADDRKTILQRLGKACGSHGSGIPALEDHELLGLVFPGRVTIKPDKLDHQQSIINGVATSVFAYDPASLASDTA